MTTLEYASTTNAPLGLPARWYMHGLTILNIGVIWMPFAWNYTPAKVSLAAWSRGGFGNELWPLTACFLASPCLAYVVLRLCYSRLRAAEWWVGIHIASFSGGALLYFEATMANMLIQAGSPDGPKYWAMLFLSGALILLAGFTAFRVSASHQRGTDIVALMMGFYAANGVWAFGISMSAGFGGWSLKGVQAGAWLCAAISVLFIAELVVLLIRDHRWRTSALRL